jgi:hypothetical protein
MPRKAAVCPPGVLCMTPTLGFILVVGICIAIGFLILGTSHRLSYPALSRQVVQQPQTQQAPLQIFTGGGGDGGGDDRYTRAPEPLRVWQSPPDLRGAMLPPGAVPINISTRGLPQQYQQMGIIKSGDKILPLYGRQTAYRSDRYNYYTRTDTYNPIQLPIRYEKRDCMDSIGCEELLGGERIKIAGANQPGEVEVYKFDGPTYIPGLV